MEQKYSCCLEMVMLHDLNYSRECENMIKYVPQLHCSYTTIQRTLLHILCMAG